MKTSLLIFWKTGSDLLRPPEGLRMYSEAQGGCGWPPPQASECPLEASGVELEWCLEGVGGAKVAGPPPKEGHLGSCDSDDPTQLH